MRTKGLSRKTGLKPKSGFAPKAPASPADAKKALERATVRALERARKDAEASGVDLSAWEDEFLSSVTQRVKTYGRAFADPEKGALGTTLSMRQGIKLKQIRKKVKPAKI